MNQTFNEKSYHNKLKLVACYQASKELFDAWNIFSRLPEDSKGRRFLGEFKEENDKLVGLFTFERLYSKKNKTRKEKARPNLMAIFINSDRTIYIATKHKNNLESLTTQSTDQVIERMLTWGAQVDNSFDERLNLLKQKDLEDPQPPRAKTNISRYAYPPASIRGPHIYY